MIERMERPATDERPSLWVMHRFAEALQPVDQECPSIAMGTASLAAPLGLPGHVVRIIAPDTDLAHKLAAWNKRRLHRDLYEVYFLVIRVGAHPELAAPEGRLQKIESRCLR